MQPHVLKKVKRISLLCVLALLFALLLLRTPLPVPIKGYVFVLLLSLPANVYWWAWGLDRILAMDRSSLRRRLWLSTAWNAYMAVMLLPLPIGILSGRSLFDRLPPVVFTWVLTWYLLIMFLAGVAALGWLGRLVWQWRRAAEDSKAAGDSPPAGNECLMRPVDLDRRRFLAHAVVAAPIVLTGMAVTMGHARSSLPRVRRVSLSLPRLPDRLRGLTVTHLTDMHVGRLFTVDDLWAVVELSNKLKSDIVTVTGDIMDYDLDDLPETCDALSQLEHRYGRLLVVGNHDLLAEPAQFVSYLGMREPHLLNDRHLPITIGGERIQIAGLFWSRRDDRLGNDPGHFARAEAALDGADPELFTMALAHHPHAFDALVRHGVDLTMVGHTHGGQIMLTPQRAPRKVGAGNLLFRYIWGEYRRGRSVLHVSAGVGNWFPVRLNAPAEIVQIQLT